MTARTAFYSGFGTPPFISHHLGLVSLPSALHQAAEAIGRLAQGVIVQVGVAGRGLGLGMAEQAADDMQAHAAADQAAGVGVAKVMETDAFQAVKGASLAALAANAGQAESNRQMMGRIPRMGKQSKGA